MKSLQLSDLPGNIRNSFHASFKNAVMTRIGQMKIKELEEKIITSETVSEIVGILKSKAKYNPKWVAYVFEVKDELFTDMVVNEFERLRREKVPIGFSNMYKHLSKNIESTKDFLPIPKDILVFKRKFDLLSELNGRPRLYFK